MLTQNLSGHYANMRKRFVQNSLKGFLDYEVIELLLKLSDNRRDQKKTAKLLIQQFKLLKDIIQYLTYNLGDKSKEAFLIIYLNGRNQIIEIEQLFEGSLTPSAVYSREVIIGI